MKHTSLVHGKSDALFEHLIYSLATGRWQAGERLPSVREAEKEWSVNRLTVLAAYRRLEAAELIEAKGRSGYFVLNGASLEDLSRHRFELDKIYNKVFTMLKQETSLLPSTVFKSLAELSSFRVHQDPEIAFVECSHYQAVYHSQECQDRFQQPITAISLDTIDRESPSISPSIRCLITTGFHYHQVSPIAEKLGLPVIKVLIQIDKDKLRNSTKDKKRLCVFEREAPIGENVQQDVNEILDNNEVELAINASDMENCVTTYLDQNDQNIALLPPRIFGTINKITQLNERIIPIDYKVIENQWPVLAKALKLPMNWFISSN